MVGGSMFPQIADLRHLLAADCVGRVRVQLPKQVLGLLDEFPLPVRLLLPLGYLVVRCLFHSILLLLIIIVVIIILTAIVPLLPLPVPLRR